jgi:hypothetical protein
MSDRLGTLYRDVVAGSYDCVDRILLNGYFGLCHSAGGFRLATGANLTSASWASQRHGRQIEKYRPDSGIARSFSAN